MAEAAFVIHAGSKGESRVFAPAVPLPHRPWNPFTEHVLTPPPFYNLLGVLEIMGRWRNEGPVEPFGHLAVMVPLHHDRSVVKSERRERDNAVGERRLF